GAVSLLGATLARMATGAAEPRQPFLPALRFRRLTPYFDHVVRLTMRERTFKRRLLDGLALQPGERVLDVGAGTATLAVELKRRCPGATVVGLDADPDVLAIARAKASQAGCELELVEGLSDALPFPDESFDAVVSTLFFHHLDGEAKRATLREVRRVLRPGGRMHVGDFTRPADPLQAALNLPVRVFDGFAVTAHNVRGALPELFSQAGLHDVRQRDRLRTAMGTLALWSARRS
nr:class I SAM-dependent methyltransferase [Actinomycetota bacterium]